MYKGKTWQEWIALALDNELEQVDQLAIENALSQSEELRSYQLELQKNRGLISAFQTTVDEGFTDGVLARLGEAKIVSFSTAVVRLFPRVAAACVILMLSTYALLQFSDATWIPESLVGTTALNPEEAYTFSIDY